MAFMAVSCSCRMAAIFVPSTMTDEIDHALLVNLMVGIACLVGVGAHVTLVIITTRLAFRFIPGVRLRATTVRAFALPSFLSGAQTIPAPVPEGYSVEDAKELISDYAGRYNTGRGDRRRSQAAAPV